MEFTVINPAPEKPSGYHTLEKGKILRSIPNDGLVFLIVENYDPTWGYQFRYVNLKNGALSSPIQDVAFPREHWEEVIPAGSIELRRL